MVGFGYDPEAVIQDADIEQAELEAAGREAQRRRRKSLIARLNGDLDEAARLCPHGAGVGRLCAECGSELDGELFMEAAVVKPCVGPFECIKHFNEPLTFGDDGHARCPKGCDWRLKSKEGA